MKLNNKLTIIISIVAFTGLGTVSAIYSSLNYENVLLQEEQHLHNNAVTSAHNIELALRSKLDVVNSFASAPIIEETLLKSNAYFDSLEQNATMDEINRLNEKWKKERTSQSDFITAYLQNPLALYLKKQQSVLPDVYGEIFVTNKYGAIVATTGVLSTLAHSHKYWWKKSYDAGKGKVFFDDRGFDESVNGYVVGIVIPIKKDGEVIGVLKSNINILGALESIVRYYENSEKGKLKIVRTKGMIVLESGKEPLSTRLDDGIVAKLNAVDSGVIIDADENLLSSYAPVEVGLNRGIEFGGKPSSSDHTKGNENEIWHAVIVYGLDAAVENSTNFNRLILYIAIAILGVVFILSRLIAKWFSKPIKELESVAQRISEGEFDLRAEINSRDETGALANSFNTMLDELKKTMASRDELVLEIQRRQEAEKHLESRTNELKVLNETLQDEVEKKTQENFKQFQILQQQSKLASMGEMIGAIAHQWRQPLNELSIRIQKLKYNYMDGKIDEEFIETFIEKNKLTIHFMSKTIDDFRNFFRIDKTKKLFDVKAALEEVVNIQAAQLKNHDIALSIEGESFSINGFKTEFQQVIMNIISNAKDILVAKKTPSAKIDITLQEHQILIYDNGGGVPEDIIDRIFEPYFTTKEENEGTGMGLYMSKMIIEDNMNGKIHVQNKGDGALFVISFDTNKRIS